MSTSAPASTYVLVVGMVATLWAFGIVVIFLPPWYWYLIPVALALPEVVVLIQRYVRRRRLKVEMQAMLQELG